MKDIDSVYEVRWKVGVNGIVYRQYFTELTEATEYLDSILADEEEISEAKRALHPLFWELNRYVDSGHVRTSQDAVTSGRELLR